MSWHYLQGQEEESWEATCLDGAPDALLNLIPTPGRSSWPDRETVISQDSPSGMMSRPLMASPGEGSSMWSREDSRVRTSRQPEGELESQAKSQDCGQKWPESWTKWDPVSCLWRTRQCSLLGGLEPFSATWPQWGLMRAGECWARTMPGHLTSATGSGSWRAAESWPTPVADRTRYVDFKQGGRSLGAEVRRRQTDSPPPRAEGVIPPGGRLNPTWVEWLMGWPTGWTALEPLGMDKYLQWLQLHGESSGEGNHE